jgi:hypothetical protein
MAVMLEERKFLAEIKRQIAQATTQYFLVAVCAVGAVATVGYGATHMLNAKLGAVLVALKRF